MNQIESQNMNPDFLFMIEQAVKAPSGHNTQPWLFKTNENSIEIHPDFKKSLFVVDPHNKELFISLGCAAENLCIAASAKGYKTKANISDGGIITIGLIKEQIPEKDPLISHIPLRQTNRSVYNGNIINDKTVSLLEKTKKEKNVSMFFYKKDTDKFDTIFTYVRRGNIAQMRDENFKEELRTWMRYNKKHQNKHNDGLSYAVFGAPDLPVFLVKPIMKKALSAKSQNKGDKKKTESSSHLVLLTTEHNTIEEWIGLGRTLERFLLKSTQLGIEHAYLNQPNEVKELSEEMKNALNLGNKYPAILLRIGYGKKMPYSKRKPIEDVIIQ